ncbi:MAG: outer membrane beta-barrel protein [Hydrogenovibrio sp.]|uniref:outer membrane protein n=1 Tax=Hydrogenovibrio sp. TaxID=2065821 RepID=UPI0028702748|nr:outer membrane beta-barrel protein [Hydrogenovibrio sp.]MDR9498206.1 outer membrane beta-barrel protein [Hydrogenovibrio sp.]
MKRFIQISALSSLMVLPGLATANIFDGPYVGAMVGLNQSEMTNIENKTTNNKTDLSEDGRKLGFGLLAGSGVSFGQFYLGAEAQYLTDLGPMEGDTSQEKAKAKEAWSGSLLGGYYGMPETLFYGRIGMAQAKVDLSVPSMNKDDEESFTLTVLGLGFKTAINEKVSASFEFQKRTGTETFDNVEYELDTNSVTAGVHYTF